ncbi:ABC transporter permease [Notoacmeibacter ruber]|uniref:ABC transporter permease n=1 Tax=Notoacmeibacter ruber TaxID=2670375 RepID=A0A3L7JBF6_9HYPH|nr:ABC transporter permease [Notoacmeibacter ruber]RLQ86851.1 ABC transporter permease [Notoacmeibacter ruber]
MSTSSTDARQSRGFRLKLPGQLSGIIGAFLIMVGIAAFVSPQFLTEYNMTIMARELAFIGIVAIAQGLLLLLGDIDVSIGAIAGLAGIVCAKLLVDFEFNPVLAIGLSILAAALAGAINGIIITTFNLNSLVVTIGMLSVYSGLNLFITQGRTIVGLPEEVTFLGSSRFLGLPAPLWIMLGLFVLVALLTTVTVYGRKLYAVGNSREAARIVGISAQKVRIVAYSLAGALAGTAGILMAFRLLSAQATLGQNWLLPSIAAPVIGGIATTGGIGTIWGALIGAAIMVVIGNIIVLGGVGIYLQQVVTGLIVVVAVVIDAVTRRFGGK